MATSRALDPNVQGGIVIRQHQDRLFLAAGQPAVLTVAAFKDGVAVAADIERSQLLRVDPMTHEAVPFGRASFRDDGTFPDRQPDDFELTASIAPTERDLGRFRGDLQVVVTVRAKGETGTLTFPLVYTGSPTAAFTGVVREVVEGGSLAIYVGVNFMDEGHYEIIGRLFSANGKPAALLRFNDVVSRGRREIRMVAFGKVLRDAAATSPFELRDLQGWRLTNGVPDRDLMLPRLQSFRTEGYPVTVFSPQEWMDPERTKRVAALRRVAGAVR